MRTLPLLLAVLVCTATSRAQDLFDTTIVRDFYFTFAQPGWWNLLLNSQTTGQDLSADLLVDGVTYNNVGMRIKGASSSIFPGNKKPFNLTMDSFVAGQDLYGSTTLNLNNGAMDPTLTRETICYEIFRSYLPAPRAAYARVHLNGTYWGIYTLIEQPNKAMLRQWFRNEDGTRYKGDRPSGAAVGTSALRYWGASSSNYTSRYEIKTPTHPNAWTDLVHMIDRLNNASSSTFEGEIEQLVDVDRAIWYFVVMNLVVNSDDYVHAGHNYYMYFNEDDGRMNMIPWDLNEAFGTHWPSTNPWNYSVTDSFTSTSRPLVRRLMAVPRWRELYYAHYRTALNQWFDWVNIIEPLNTRLQNLIRADVQNDPNYLYPMNLFNPSFNGRVWSQFHYIHGLREVIVNRRAFLLQNSNLTKSEPQIDQVTQLTQSPQPGQPVWVTARVQGTPAISAVVLRSAARGPFAYDAMFDDGMHNDGAPGDGVYGGSFTAGPALTSMRYYIHATDTVGTVQVEPKGAALHCYSFEVDPGQPVGPIVLNEFVADNDTGDVDEAGEFEDWIELHNTGAQPYDIGNHYLTDDPTEPKKWLVPANTPIPAGGFVRVWADNEPGDGRLHATFKLSKSGEAIMLSDTDANQNRFLDGVRFDEQKSDRAYGRVPDAAANWYFVYSPTGAAPLLSPGAYTRYDCRRTASPTDFDLRGSGAAQVGNTFNWDLDGGTPFGAALLVLSLAPDKDELLPWGWVAIDLTAPAAFVCLLDGLGECTVSLPVPATAAGVDVYAQALHNDLSNALVVRFMP